MNRDESLMEKLAESIINGELVDWAQEEGSAETPDARSWVRNLRIVSEIASFHSTSEMPTQVAHPQEGVEDQQVVASRRPIGTWGTLDLLEKVGEGGFGEVYRAWDPRLEREVALKLIRRLEPEPEELAPSILEEGRLMARIDHPNVVKVYGAERHDGRVGIWMEFVRGRTLADIVSQSRFSADEATMIGTQVCGAVAAVHAKGMIHSDVKAQNVMRDDQGRYFLMDFSAGKRTDGSRAPVDDRVSGTVPYMPPEVFEGRAMSVRGDIYSIGVLLYNLVSGSYPVTGSSISEIRKAHRTGERNLLRDVRPDLPEGFHVVVERALAQDPGDRFASAGEMQQALTRSTHDKVPEPSAPSPSKTRFLLPVAAVASLIAAVALGTFLIFQNVSPVTYSVEAALYRAKENRSERLVPGARVKPGDQVYLDFEASESLYVYILNRDEQGENWTLFPRSDSTLKNPLPAGRVHRLPGTSVAGNAQMYWEFTSAGGREQILVVASPERLEEIEREIASIPEGAGPFAKLSEKTTRRLRGLGGVATRPETATSSEASRSFEVIKRLATTPEKITGVWVRQIDLENPLE